MTETAGKLRVVGGAFGAAVAVLSFTAVYGAEHGVIDRYKARLTTVNKNLPDIAKCAERVAERWIKHEKMYVNVAFGGDNSNFAMEMHARAGGLGNMLVVNSRKQAKQVTDHDVLLIGPRCWEKGKDHWIKKLPEFKKQGSLIIVFASAEGLPDGLAYDYLFDNGATSGSHAEGAMNSLVNITQGWLWCCELVSALNRHGKRPAVLKGMLLPGAEAHNHKFGHGNPGRPGFESTLWPCDTPIPAGEAAKTFLEAVEKELATLQSPDIQRQLNKAAELAVARIRSGRTVWMASMTHFLDGEVLVDNKSPFHAFHGMTAAGDKGKTFSTHLKKGDLFFWWGEWTINLPWSDCQREIRATEADMIPSFRLLKKGERYEGYPHKDDTSEALMVLEQRWPYEGAVVPIPFPPGKMAPVTGIHVGLLYRMLDEAVYERLSQSN